MFSSNRSQISLRTELDETNGKISKLSHELDDFKEKVNEKVEEKTNKVNKTTCGGKPNVNKNT
jgi:hypothetical protein